MISVGTDIVKVSRIKNYLIIKDLSIRFFQKKKSSIVFTTLSGAFI